MSKKSNLKPIAATLGATFIVSLTVSPGANAADNPFGITELSKGGYMIAAGIAKHEQDAETHIKLGKAKFIQGDYHGAIADFDRAIELSPDSAAAYYYRGRVKSELDDHDGTIADYDRAIELNLAIEIKPDYAEAYSNRGDAQIFLRDYDSAIADYDKVIELYPDSAAAYRKRGTAKSLLGDKRGAREDYTRSIELDSALKGR